MKWCILINNAQFIGAFFGKIARQLVSDGEEVLVVFNSKISEYEKKKFFPEKAKFISKPDWCEKNYDENKKIPEGFSWREIYPIYARFRFYKFDYKNCYRAVNQIIQLFQYIFIMEKPDVIISETPAGLFHEIAYNFCQKNKINYFGFSESRVSGRTDIYNREWTCPRYEEDFKKLKKENLLSGEVELAKDFTDKFIFHKTPVLSMARAKIRFNLISFISHYQKRIRESGAPLLKYFFNRSKFKNCDYESQIILNYGLVAPFLTIKRNIKIFLQAGVFKKMANIEKEKYFFFPLQYEPEASTLVLATYYSNQLNTIRNAAFTLPMPYKLYLKEHPASVGLRSAKFYREIRKIPNAVLLSPGESTQKIIDGSLGVITMTSTVGFEAALAGKPVYVLGNVFYNYHPSCRRILNFDDLKLQIEKDMHGKTEDGRLDETNSLFLASYIRNNIVGNIASALGNSDLNDYKLICQMIKSLYLKLK